MNYILKFVTLMLGELQEPLNIQEVRHQFSKTSLLMKIYKLIGYKNCSIQIKSIVYHFITAVLDINNLTLNGSHLNLIQRLSQLFNEFVPVVQNLKFYVDTEVRDQANFVIKCCNLLQFFAKHAIEDDEVGLWSQQIQESLNENDRDSILIKLLDNSNFKVRLSAVNLLNQTDHQQFDNEEIEQFSNSLSHFGSILEDQNEIIISTLLMIFSKIVNSSMIKETFIQTRGLQFTIDIMRILLKNLNKTIVERNDQ